jgi:hypothetical protein
MHFSNEGEFVLGNREKFVSKWGRIRQNGKAKFILKNGLLFTATYWVILSAIILIGKRDFSKIAMYFSTFTVSILTYIITLPIAWNKNESKYNELLGIK